MFPEFSELNLNLQTAVLIIALAFYLIQCLFGYKLFKFSCALVGFVIGLLLGLGISTSIFHLTGAWPPIIGVLAGILLAFLAYKLFLVGLFALAFLLAFSLASLIPFPNTGAWNVFALVLAAAIAVIVGILAVRFSRVVIIVVTAVGGAMNAVNTFNQITEYLSAPLYYWLSFAVLAAIGLLLQFLTNRK